MDINDILIANASGMQAGGSVAQRLLACGMNVSALRTCDVLRKEEWVVYDEAVVAVARSRLVAVGDLLSKGLRYNLSNGLGTTVVQWEKVSDMTAANISMSGLTEGERDRVDFSLNSLPVPITHKDFNINIRNLEASRRTGETLDTTQAVAAARKVSEQVESMLFSGASITAGGGTIYGYTNFPSRNTGSVTASWATATGEQILGDVLTMIGALQADNMFGPYVIYVPIAAYLNMQEDFKAASDRTTMERILALPEIEAVKPSANLATTNVVMVQMTSDVVDVVVGMEPGLVQWESHGGMMVNFKAMSIIVPRLKADYDGRCGIAHYS